MAVHYPNHTFLLLMTVQFMPIKLKLKLQKTIPLIKDGMVILTGAGTTIIEFVKQLPENLQSTFFTIIHLVAVELSKCPMID